LLQNALLLAPNDVANRHICCVRWRTHAINRSLLQRPTLRWVCASIMTDSKSHNGKGTYEITDESAQIDKSSITGIVTYSSAYELQFDHLKTDRTREKIWNNRRLVPETPIICPTRPVTTPLRISGAATRTSEPSRCRWSNASARWQDFSLWQRSAAHQQINPYYTRKQLAIR